MSFANGFRITAAVVLVTIALCWLVPTYSAANAKEPPGHTTVRIAQLRAVPEKWNLEANFKLFLKLLDQADKQQPDFFITPEAWLDGYAAADKTSTPEKLRGVAQDPENSPYLQRVSSEAKKRGMFICFGFTSLEGGKIYNAAGLWDADGKLIGVYHKTHLQNHDLQYTPGEGLPVWDTPWGPVGIMICADRRWPETARCLRLQGTRLILNPTYGFRGDFNTAMMRTRAYENQCFIAFTHPEESLVTGPRGKVLTSEVGEEPAVFITEIDLAEARDDNHLQDRRPEIYTIITETD